MSNYIKLGGIVVVLLFIYICLLCLLPTYDDWGYLASPFVEGGLLKYLPGIYWRPFDALFGDFLSYNNNYCLFPYVNHTVIYLAHVLSTCLIIRISKLVGINSSNIYICALFFFFSPACLGTLLGIDSINQAYATFFGILACMVILSNNKYRYVLSLFFALLSIFSKDNGLSWLFIPAILSFGFGYVDKKQLICYLSGGIGVAILYFICRYSLTVEPVVLKEDSAYTFSLFNRIKDAASFIIGTFFAVDPIFLIGNKTNILLFSLTSVASIPFIYIVFFYKQSIIFTKKFKCLLICLIIAVGPHLATHFGPMHAYSGLPIASLIIGVSLSCKAHYFKPIFISFMLYFLSMLFVDIHHYIETYKSSQYGIIMARNAESVLGTDKPTKLFVISEYDYKRYSSFCVPPREVFMYGQSLKWYNHYEWPKICKGITIKRPNRKQLDSIIVSNSNFDCFLYTNGVNIYKIDEIIKSR